MTFRLATPGEHVHMAKVVGRHVAATILAPLPHSWRFGLDERWELPIDRCALPSALLQVAVGVTIWTLGLNAWIDAAVSEIEAKAAALPKGYRNEALIYGSLAVKMNPVLVIVFTLTTLRGFLSALVVLGGLVRLFAIPGSWENHPGPLLSATEWGRREILGRIWERKREREKGDDTPDSLLASDGAEGWHLRIVSRDAYPWYEGASVRVDGVHHRLVRRHEMRDGKGRLRFAHDLQRCADVDVFRGNNVYQPRRPAVRKGGQAT